MNARIRLVTGESAVIAADALHLWLADEPTIEVAGTGADAEHVAALTARLRPRLVLLDLNTLPAGSASRIAELRHSGAGVFVLCSALDRHTLSAVIGTGAEGCAGRLADRRQLVGALERVAHGGTFYGDEVAEAFAESQGPLHDFDIVDPARWELAAGAAGVNVGGAVQRSLTERERQILRLVAVGQNSHDIASGLSISLLTVRKHRENLMKKLDLHNIAEVTAFAIRNGLLASHRHEV